MRTSATQHLTQARRDGWTLHECGVLLPAMAMAMIATLTLGCFVEPWGWMWLLAFAVFAGCKWLSWREAFDVRTNSSAWRSVAYFFAWPGLNAREFLGSEIPARPVITEWMAAIIKTLFGAAMIWLGCRIVFIDNRINAGVREMLTGWVGMIGLIFLLHFGVFHLLSLMWRATGVKATNLFNRPMAASSLSDFWSHRWNRAFRDIAHEVVFRPLAPRIGAAGAMMACFVVSGLVHDLVISLPSHGGYGLPTAYFALQGFGVLFERSPIGARMGLRRGFRGWLFMAIVTAAPAYWLFHPPSVRGVIVPFLHAIGAM